jgi:HD-like signal output (HDOD) protein
LAELFTAGLLANIGKLTLALTQSSSYSALLSRRLDTKAQLAMEQSLFGFNHLSLAAALMQDWKIPLLFCDAVFYHELPSTSGLPDNSRAQEVVWTLNLASRMAELGCNSTVDVSQIMPKIETALGHLNLTWDEFPDIYTNAGQEWRDWIRTMNLGPSPIWQELQQDPPLESSFVHIGKP